MPKSLRKPTSKPAPVDRDRPTSGRADGQRRGARALTRPGAAHKPATLKHVPPLEALDFETLSLAIFSCDVGAGLDDPLRVLWHFVESVRRGYAPPDEMLHWLAARFDRYLKGGPKSPRLDECLGLAPGTVRSGRREARTREANTVRQQLYVTRLALLEFAGFTQKRAVLSLTDGVTGILGPIETSVSRYAPGSLATKASQWRKREDYRKTIAMLKDAESRLPVIAKLRAASSAKAKRK